MYLPLALRGLSNDPCHRYEPNNTLSTAFGPLSNGEAIEAALCDGDPNDYYFVELPAGTTLTLNLTNIPAGVDYDLLLYDVTGGDPIAQSRGYGTTPEHIEMALESGRYFVRVDPYQGRSLQPYRLSVSWGAAVQAETPARFDWSKPLASTP